MNRLTDRLDMTLTMSEWPHTLENRENGEKKIPAGKNQGI